MKALANVSVSCCSVGMVSIYFDNSFQNIKYEVWLVSSQNDVAILPVYTGFTERDHV
jgi:hypothetical protein